MYDDFKLKTEMVSMVYTKIFQRSNNLLVKPTFLLSLMYYWPEVRNVVLK